MIVRGVECINVGLHPFIVKDMMHAFFAFTAAGETIASPPLDSVVSQMVGLAEKAYLENDGSFQSLVVSLLSSDSFLYRR